MLPANPDVLEQDVVRCVYVVYHQHLIVIKPHPLHYLYSNLKKILLKTNTVS